VGFYLPLSHLHFLSLYHSKSTHHTWFTDPRADTYTRFCISTGHSATDIFFSSPVTWAILCFCLIIPFSCPISLSFLRIWVGSLELTCPLSRIATKPVAAMSDSQCQCMPTSTTAVHYLMLRPQKPISILVSSSP
jgi:hypothetical protein